MGGKELLWGVRRVLFGVASVLSSGGGGGRKVSGWLLALQSGSPRAYEEAVEGLKVARSGGRKRKRKRKGKEEEEEEVVGMEIEGEGGREGERERKRGKGLGGVGVGGAVGRKVAEWVVEGRMPRGEFVWRDLAEYLTSCGDAGEEGRRMSAGLAKVLGERPEEGERMVGALLDAMCHPTRPYVLEERDVLSQVVAAVEEAGGPLVVGALGRPQSAVAWSWVAQCVQAEGSVVRKALDDMVEKGKGKDVVDALSGAVGGRDLDCVWEVVAYALASRSEIQLLASVLDAPGGMGCVFPVVAFLRLAAQVDVASMISSLMSVCSSPTWFARHLLPGVLELGQAQGVKVWEVVLGAPALVVGPQAVAVSAGVLERVSDQALALFGSVLRSGGVGVGGLGSGLALLLASVSPRVRSLLESSGSGGGVGVGGGVGGGVEAMERLPTLLAQMIADPSNGKTFHATLQALEAGVGAGVEAGADVECGVLEMVLMAGLIVGDGRLVVAAARFLAVHDKGRLQSGARVMAFIRRSLLSPLPAVASGVLEWIGTASDSIVSSVSVWVSGLLLGGDTPSNLNSVDWHTRTLLLLPLITP